MRQEWAQLQVRQPFGFIENFIVLVNIADGKVIPSEEEAIKEEDISSFLTKLGIILRPFGYSAEIISTIINFEERTRTS